MLLRFELVIFGLRKLTLATDQLGTFFPLSFVSIYIRLCNISNCIYKLLTLIIENMQKMLELHVHRRRIKNQIKFGRSGSKISKKV